MNMKIAAVILMLVNIVWEAFLEILDQRSLNNKIPECVQDVYDQEEYRKWRSYKVESKRVNVIGSTVGFLASLILVIFDFYAAFARLFPQNIYLQLMSVVLLSAMVSIVTGLPFSIYRTFVIEEKYGFNRTTKKTFITDQIKDLIIELVLETGLISLFAALHQSAGDWFIPAFAAAFVLIGLLLSLLSPALTRIFNKFKPLEDGELREKLTQLLTSHGYRVRSVEVMDASRRSTKMNAYFTGIGPTKTIVLYDTLAEALTTEEICAVFAHEMGHGIHHDMMKNQLLSVASSLVVACAAWLVVANPSIFADFGFDGINYGFALILMGWLMGIISPLMSWISSQFSRRAEYRADATAADEGYGPALVSGLKTLARKNLADLSPDPLLVKLTYSHPTLAQRIEAIEKKTAGQDA